MGHTIAHCHSRASLLPRRYAAIYLQSSLVRKLTARSAALRGRLALTEHKGLALPSSLHSSMYGQTLLRQKKKDNQEKGHPTMAQPDHFR